jgi:hypothetical protein
MIDGKNYVSPKTSGQSIFVDIREKRNLNDSGCLQKVKLIQEMARAAPQIGLCCEEKLFPVRVSSLLQRCSLFRDKPQLLACDAYEVNSKVDISAFVEFVKAVRGEPYSLARPTAPGVWRLSE